MEEEKINVTVIMNRELFDRTNRLAKKEDLDRAKLIRKALREYLDRHLGIQKNNN